MKNGCLHFSPHLIKQVLNIKNNKKKFFCLVVFLSKTQKLTVMSLATFSARQYVAIPATFWGENCIKKEPWYDRRGLMYYYSEVNERRYFFFDSKTKFHVCLLVTDHVLWLTEEELEKYNLTKIPQNAEVLGKNDEQGTDYDKSDDENLATILPPDKKRAKTITSVQSRYHSSSVHYSLFT